MRHPPWLATFGRMSPLFALLVAASCNERPDVTDPRALGPARAAHDAGSGETGRVFICKSGSAPGSFTFNFSAATSPPTTGTFQLMAGDCNLIWDVATQGTPTITVSEVPSSGSSLNEVNYDDGVAGVTLQHIVAPPGGTLDGTVFTITPTAGLLLNVNFINVPTQPPPNVCTNPNALNFGGPLPCVFPPPVCPPTSISSNFNGTPVAAGNTVWFNAVFKPSGVPSTGGTVNFSSGVVTFTSNGTNFSVSVPPSIVTFSPTATTATTSFDGTTWNTTVPASYTGNIFLGGAAFVVPAGGLPGGTNPVNWSESMTTNMSGMHLNWQWGAAVFTSFSTNLDLLGVKPVDDNKLSAFQNSDHAGTPENFKSSVVGGARGGGGSNFTGSYSGTGSTTPCLTTP